MRRAIQALMLVVVVGQAAGLLWVASVDVCADDCEDDARGRSCPPVCPTCACSARPSPTVPVAAPSLVEPVRLIEVAVFPERERTPTNPEPHEILHVPKSLAV